MSLLGWIKEKCFGRNGFNMVSNDYEVMTIKQEAKEHWAEQKRATDQTRISFSNMKKPENWIEKC